MEKPHLENAKKIFLGHSQDNDYYKDNDYYAGRNLPELGDLIKMLGYVIPNKITSTELIVYLEFLVTDIKEGVCRFNNSQKVKELFSKYIQNIGNVEKGLTYFPGFVKTISPPEFYEEFIDLFKSSFYQLNFEDDTENNYGYIEVSNNVIDISNKDKADVLAALYNHAKPIGMGIVQYDPTPMTKELAQYILEKMGTYFDYLKGRPIKCNLGQDIICVSNYNRDNDQDNLGQIAIATCPNVNKDGSKKYHL